MNTEQLRADFEAWIASPPYEKPLGINPEASGFPGQYRAYEVQLAWEAYQAGRAALQSQVNSEAADRVREFLDNWLKIRLNDKTVVYQLNDHKLRVDDLRALLALQSQDREDALRDALAESVRELQACQAVIHLAGGFDPAYVNGAQDSLKKSRAILARDQAAIEVDRKRQGEVVVTKTPEGEIIAVTRQDAAGKILSVIAEADRKRRGEPVAFAYELGARLVDGEYSIWSPRLTFGMPNVPDGSIRNLTWLYAAPVVKESLTAAEPVKVLSDAELIEFATEEQFLLFCDKDEFVDIARALLARYGSKS